MPWAGMNHSEEILGNIEGTSFSGDIWNETPFRDVAIPEQFTFLSFINYSDVGILINNESDESKTIGYAFVAARNISVDRIFLFDNESTPTAETINPNQFDTYFAEPLRQMISDRNLTTELNYLVTTKGIPLRINGPGDGKASFDSEIGLINGAYNSTIHENWWATHTYGPGAGEEMKRFSRQEEGFYLVTRLTGYTVDTALGLIDKANNSFGERGIGVLDLATNRNGSGYKWWNDLLYSTNSTMNGTMGIPVHFNQNSTFVTNQSNVMFYASWGSNDGSWNDNWLPNSGFDTSSGSWTAGAKYWSANDPPLSGTEDFEWLRQTAVKKNGNGALEGTLSPGPCTVSEASSTSGLLAEYFDNSGVTYNSNLMPDLSNRNPDYWRSEPNINHAVTGGTWAGLDSSQFSEYYSARHSGAITIPDSGNWTFYLNSDDGSKLWVDNTEVISNVGVHGMREISGTTWLSSGTHTLRTEFFEHGGHAGLILSWQGPNQSKQVIPSSAFTRGVADSVTTDLAHHWSFDEGSGTSITDSIGDANLTLFNSNNGAGWQQCLFGNCYQFDGVDDYAKIDVNDWAGNFSVSLWTKTGNVSQDRYSSAFAVNDVAGDSDSFQIMTSGSNSGDWEVYHNVSYSFGAIEAGVWTHLAVTYENNTLKQYLNGALIQTNVVPNGSIDSIELYKVGVNRGGNAYYEGLIDDLKVWNRTLQDSEVAEVNAAAAIICSDYSNAGSGETSVEQDYDFSDDLKDHAWIIYGHGLKDGWITGNYRIEVDSFDDNDTLLVTNTSSTQNLATSWNSITMRFRPPANAASFKIKMVSLLDTGSRNGSVYFDTMNLRAIRPHFEWVDGSIAETAVSTGGRTFAWGATYGQSLVVDLLEDGVSGVKGYVYEPYLSAMGYPDTLLPYYANGYNFAEVNYAANPMISWMGTVVGDPKMAPYADILHDVELEAVRTNGTLSIGVNGSIDIIVQNLAPGIVNGTLEVRDRNGNSVLANVSLQMPGGNDIGSRRIVSVNLTPTRVGFNEYVIRYAANDWLNPEREVENNIAIINTQVNGPPEIEGLSCTSWTVHRGGTVGCTTTGNDDLGLTQARLGWRVNGSGENWTFINSTSLDFINWYSSLKIPTDIELGKLDLISEVRDAQNQVALFQLNDVLTITNAPHTWFGVHVEGIDPENWNGVMPLSDNSAGEVTRDSEITLKACVVDPDHDPDNELPMIITNNGNVTEVQPTESQFSDVFCYQAIWRMDWGSSTKNTTIFLYDASGNLFTTRVIPVYDKPFDVDLELTDFNGNLHTLAQGTGERIIISLSDSDDLLSDYHYQLKFEWPGQIEEMIEGDIEADGTPRYNSSVTLAPPAAGLEFGELKVELEITDTADYGITQIIVMNWTMHLQPPLAYDIGFCEGGDTSLTRGEDVRGWVTIDPNRVVEAVSFNLAQSGNVKPMQSSQWDWDDCQFPDSAEYHWGFILNADNSFSAGKATLQVVTSDIDGLRGVSDFEIDIFFALPTVVSQSGEVREGEFGDLEALIDDSDGHEGTLCTFIIIDANGAPVMESDGPLTNNGVYSTRWMPPTEGAPFSSTIGCTDAQGNQVAHTRQEIIPALGDINDSNNSDKLNDSNTDTKSISTLIVAAGAGALIIAILATILLLALNGSRKNEFEIIDEPSEISGWSAPSDSRIEGEQNIALAEMAMGELEEISTQNRDMSEVEEILQNVSESEPIEEENEDEDTTVIGSSDQDLPPEDNQESVLLKGLDEPKD